MSLQWFFGFFAVSGFCSLIYQVVWMRLAMADFGVTTPMVSIVLSVFMAGLALGSWGAGALVERIAQRTAATPLRLYAAAELLIALSGETVPQALARGRHLLAASAGGAEWGSLSHYAVSGAWITLVLLPFCACMGATFPLAMAAIRKSQGGDLRSFSYLYVANVIGASLGSLLSAFVLIEILGFRGTLRLTAALNGLLAVAALTLSVSARPAGSGTKPPPVPNEAPPAFSRRTATAMLFTTGLVSMAMEVVWVRQFTPYLGTVVYAFASILALYLLATFVGSRLYRGWARSPRRHGDDGRVLWSLLGFSGLLPLLAADPRLPLPDSVGFVRVVLGVAPFCAAAGFLTPLLVDRDSAGDARRAGTAYAVNVLGCILGPLLAGFGLLPFVGERWSLVTLALPVFGVAWLAMGRSGDDRPPAAGFGVPRSALVASLVGSLVLLAVTRDYETLYPRRELRRDSTATVIATGQGLRKRLVVNGVGMASLTPITKMMAHLPLVFLEEPPRNALVICFGMGTSFRSLLSWGIPATAVELVPSVPELFSYYHSDADELLRSRGARIVVDDGRRFLERTSEQFDVITVDPPPPVEAAGSSLLYSREFYRVVKKRLRPRGVLQQWLPGADAATESAVTQALLESFPYVRGFGSLEGWGIHFLASSSPLPSRTASELSSRLPPAAADDLLEWNPSNTAQRMFDAVLRRPAKLDQIVMRSRIPALEDDRPVNEYYFLRRVMGAN